MDFPIYLRQITTNPHGFTVTCISAQTKKVRMYFPYREAVERPCFFHFFKILGQSKVISRVAYAAHRVMYL